MNRAPGAKHQEVGSLDETSTVNHGGGGGTGFLLGDVLFHDRVYPHMFFERLDFIALGLSIQAPRTDCFARGTIARNNPDSSPRESGSGRPLRST